MTRDGGGESNRNSSKCTTYRNITIIAVLDVPNALLGGVLPRFGRKDAVATSTALTGVFLYASTTATTSNALLGWDCAYNFMSNIMYAVLYAYIPEIFPTSAPLYSAAHYLLPRGFGRCYFHSSLWERRVYDFRICIAIHIRISLISLS